MKRQDKQALEHYLQQLELVRSIDGANPFETNQEQENRINRAKKDVEYMVEYYFPHYAKAECTDFQVEWANKVKRTKKFYGFAKWARGHAKSVWNNVFIPFWLWLNGEDVYFVLIGQNHDRAKQLLDDLRAEFEANPRIIHDFGEQKQLGTWEAGLFITQGRFIGQAIGLGQSCRGLRVKDKRPTLINGDDLETRKTLKNPKIQDELVSWIEQELLPAMDNPDYERFILSNNWFAPQMFIKKLAKKHPDWYVHEVKAYDKTTYKPTWNKYTAQYFKGKEIKMGVSSAYAEYLHEAKTEGEIFKEEMTQWAKLPRLDHFKKIIIHWDIAYAGNPTSDYNAIRVWGLYKNDFYYIDGYVAQSKMKPALRWLADFSKRLPKSVKPLKRAESQFWNDAVKNDISTVEKEENIQLKISFVQLPKTKKYDRIVSGLEAFWQNGRIYWNEKLKSQKFCSVGLQQLYGIEPGYKTHDDAPDADEQCISELCRYISYSTNNRKPKTGKVKSKNII